jgi:hypothetical protein
VAVILAIAASRVVRLAPLHVALPGGAVGQQRGGVDVGGHVAELRLRELEVGQRAGRTSAATAVASASSSARRAKPSAAPATDGAEDVQRAHRELEALAGAPSIAPGTGSRETQARQRVRRDHLEPFGDAKPGVSGCTTKALMPRVPGASPGAREHAIHVGDAAVADPGLLAVQHVVVAVDARPQAIAADVGAGLGFGERKGGDPFATRHARQHLAPAGRRCRPA